MELLFIQGGSRWKRDTNGDFYTDANFTEKIWDRYRTYCDHFTVILRGEKKLYPLDEAKRKFNYFNSEISTPVFLIDLYRPVKNIFDIKLRRNVDRKIREQVFKADKIIIRSIGNFYTNSALKWARYYKKPYLVEETGFSFESLWYHSAKGKLVAVLNEIQTKLLMKDVPYAIYVTNEALQKRYPCRGESIGCSDVEVVIDEEVLEKRIKKIKNSSGKMIVGTAAFLDVGWKGQKYVIRAIAELKKRNIDKFEYQLVGVGMGDKLIKEARKLGVEESVKILGSLPHEKIFDWMDSLDLYIQPSFMEGLCRSIVEAMSRACPVLSSDVGGNYELIDHANIFKIGNSRDIADKLQKFISKEYQADCARRNFEKAKGYEKTLLDEKRNEFLKDFLCKEDGADESDQGS